MIHFHSVKVRKVEKETEDCVSIEFEIPGDLKEAFHVKKAEGGVFSTWANEELNEGDILEVLPPTGKFYTELNPSQKKNYVAFAAGSGITPVLSIIKTTLLTEPQSSFTL